MSGAPTLPRCTDPPSSRLPVLNCAAIPDEGGFSHNGTEVREHLCPTLDRLLRASCSQLASPKTVASLLASELGLLSAAARPSRAIDPSQPATLMTGHCAWPPLEPQTHLSASRLIPFSPRTLSDKPGHTHEPTGLAGLLVHLASVRHYDAEQPLRFVSTNSNNGWAALVVAAYLQRTHGTAPFLGLAVNDLGTEHATTRNIRALLLKLGLSWRFTDRFDAAADAALLTYFPQVRNPLAPTAMAPARTLLPVSWVGSPLPFDVCFRMGEYDAAAVLEDGRRLGGFCRHFAYRGRPATAVERALFGVEKPLESKESAGHHARAAMEVGGFTVLSGHAAPSADFAFVNKTPPSARELYRDDCMRDMAPCDWHRGVPTARRREAL